MENTQVINEIKNFLDGSNDELQYLVHVETDRKTNKAVCFIHEPNQEPKTIEVRYTPFLYIKDLKKHNRVLFNGDRDYTKRMMKKYGISMKRMKTGKHPRLENGYPYKVTSSESYDAITQFFKEGGIDMYEVIRDPNGNVIRDNRGKLTYINRDLFYNVRPEEQFFISTGARLFKGIEEYKDVNRMTFDIETYGLRPELMRIFAIGIKDTRGLNIVLKANEKDSDEEEARLIQDFFNLIILKKPAVLVGYNSEDFDMNFIIKRAEIVGLDLKKIRTTLHEKKELSRKKATVKFGNSTDRYVKTEMWGVTILDILHAVKRTVAVNTEIKNHRLKYICQYEGIAKPDRMYIDGSDGGIGKMWDDNLIHLINRNNNRYLEVPKHLQQVAKDFLFLQHKKQSLTDEKYAQFRKHLLNENKEFVDWIRENSSKLYGDNDSTGQIEFTSGKDILEQYLLDDLWETEQVDNLYNQSSFLLAKIVPTTYGRVATMGNAAVWNLLMTTWSYENDLAIPHPDEIEHFSGGLTRCYKKGWTKRVAKIDYASLYPMIQLTHGVFPMFDITGVIKKMLMYMTTTRNIYKKLASGAPLKDEEVELMKVTDHETYDKYVNDSFTKSERSMYKVKQLPIKILNNSLFGALGSGFAFNWSDNICAARITCTGRIELRHAISWFKGYGLEPLLAVTDGVNFGIPDETNIKIRDDYETDTDTPMSIEEAWQYKGEVGLGAIIAKFNDEEMTPPFMSVDNDGEFKACLNLSRINYALLTDKDKIKLTGNTIKSKTMPEYIEEFVDNGMRMILEGRGVDFVNYYHDYAERIFYKQIPLKKIASKSKFKMTIQDYMNRGTDKNGKMKARQAHMELVIADREQTAREVFDSRFEEIIAKRVDEISNKQVDKDGNLTKAAETKIEELTNKAQDDFSLEEIFDLADIYMPPSPELDSLIYYVNNGTRKSHGDVKTKKIKDENGKVVSEEVQINATLIKTEDLENNPDLMGEYNVDKYLDAFNKRVEVLLDGFDEEVRDKILVKIKRSMVKDASGKKVEKVDLIKNEFTSKELQLKNFEHDKYKPSMYLEEKELEFWNRSGYDPTLIWDGFSTNKNDLMPQIYDYVLNSLSDKMEKAGKPRLKSVNDDIESGDYVLIKNFNNYSIGYHNGEFIEIINPDVQNVPESPDEKRIREEREKFEEELLEKLKEGEDITISDELKAKLLKRDQRNQYFIEFKEHYGLDQSLSQRQLFGAEPNAEKAFEDFIESKQPKEPDAEYMMEDYD